MAQDQSALSDLLESLRSADGWMVMNRLGAGALQALGELAATEVIGAGRHERTATRTTQRNGVRPKTVTTLAGDVTVAIPKTRTGSFFPSLLEPRRRIDRALHAVICEAYVHGVSTRKVDDLVVAMGGLSTRGEEPGEPDLRRPRRGGRRLRRPAVDRAVSLPVPRRHLRQGPPRRPGGVPGGGGRDRRVR